MDYYFVAAALPPLHFDAPPEVGFDLVMFVLEVNLSQADLGALHILRRFYDLQNAKSFWQGLPIDQRGNLDANALEEVQHRVIGIPDYILNFLTTHGSTEARLRNFPALQADYFRVESQGVTGFLRDYLAFEREWRLVAAVWRAKQLKRDLVLELQWEDPQEDFVAQLLVQRDSDSFDPPDGYKELKAIFERYAENPLELHQAICYYRFEKIEAMLGADLFSIDRILGYVAQLITIEKWFELDRQKGMQIVDSIVKEKL